MADEGTSPPPESKPGLDKTEAAKQLEREIQEKSATLAPILRNGLERQAALGSMLGDGRNFKLIKDLVDSPTLKVLQDFIANAPSTKLMSETIANLGKSPLLPYGVLGSGTAYKPMPLPPSPAAQTVIALHEVRKELAGLATILTQGANQNVAQVELTTASLTALNAVLQELKKSRRSNRALVVLTIVLVVAAALAIPGLRDQIAPAWRGLQSLF